MKSNVDTKHTIPALNDDMIWILGRPNFWCASVANVLRQDGQEIKTKAEHEQAAVIHWLLSLLETWRRMTGLCHRRSGQDQSQIRCIQRQRPEYQHY